MENRFELMNDGRIYNHSTCLCLTRLEIVDLLNEQDERIKDLEKQLSTATMYHGCDAIVNGLKQENQWLKEQLSFAKMGENFEQEKKNAALKFQNDKAIEVLERVKEIILKDGMKFCAECYQETFRDKNFDQKDQQIAELKQQLEEELILSEERRQVIEQLTAQLAETDNCTIDSIERRSRVDAAVTEKDKENKRILKNWKNSKLQQTRLYNELKAKLHTQPKEIVEKIKTLAGPMPHNPFEPPYMWIVGKSDFDKILKEYEEK